MNNICHVQDRKTWRRNDSNRGEEEEERGRGGTGGGEEERGRKGIFAKLQPKQQSRKHTLSGPQHEKVPVLIILLVFTIYFLHNYTHFIFSYTV
jgi:hypothetical protein